MTSVSIINTGDNGVEIESGRNSVVVSVMDITTTTYFLSDAMTLQKHKEAGV
ncbi:MAG TPA: hypothetical protein VN441_16280 [Syntrophomonas sp.]|nr:hypothetical protein [Syntrophomonas sp.]